MRWLLVLVTLALAAPKPAGHPAAAAGAGAKTGERAKLVRTSRGLTALRQNRPLAAMRVFERQLRVNPDAPAPNVAYGRALMKFGRCDEALEHLWPYIGTTPFGERAALAAADCSVRLRLYDDALYFQTLAVEMRPMGQDALTQLATTLDRVGDHVSADEVIERLESDQPDREDRSWAVKATIALSHGDVESFDVDLALAHRSGVASVTLRRMSAQLWLDLGDPIAALDLLHGLSARMMPTAVRAEAFRRLGELSDAERVLAPLPGNSRAGIRPDCIRARLAVDEGDLPAARELLEGWLGVDDAELAASWWYLARAEGDAAEEATWKAEYERLQESPLRRLEDLTPIWVPPHGR